MFHLQKILYIAFLLGLSVQLSVAAGWASQDMDKCRDIQISGGEQDLQDFPVPVNLDKDEEMLSDYSDLRFYSQACGNGGEKLDFEFEERDSSNVEAWIRVPKLESSGKTVSVYYDNKTPVASAEASTQVWDSDFRTVQHLEKEVPGDGGDFSGSTNNQIFGETLNGVSTSSTGIFDGAYAFDGEDDALNFSDSFAYSDSEAFTLSLWFNRTEALDGNDRLLGFNVNSSWGLFFDKDRLDGGSDLLFGYNESVLASNISSVQDTLHSAALRYDGAGNIDLFVNGTLANSTSTAEWINPSEDFGLGATGYNDFLSGTNLSFGGIIDEFRVSTKTRSEAWIEASTDFLLDETSVNVSQEVEKVNITIHSPQERYLSNGAVKLSAASEPEVMLKYSEGTGYNETGSHSHLYYTNSSGILHNLHRDTGKVESMGISAEVLGESGQLDSDEETEVPYVNGSGYLNLIDSMGDKDTLVSGGISTSKEVIGTGSWQSDEEYVFFVDDSDNNYIKKARVGEVSTVSGGIQSKGVLGPADFDNDGDRELVFLGTSDTIKYLDDGQIYSTGFSSFGSNNNKGLGNPADINGDGKVRVPYVTGSNNLALIDHNGNKEKINQNYGQAIKTRISAVQWDGDLKKELIHLGSSSKNLKLMYYNGTDRFIKDPQGDKLTGEGPVGVSSGETHSLNHTEDYSNGTYTFEVWPYKTDQYWGYDSVKFTVDTAAPTFRNFGDNTTSDFFKVDTANISAEASDQYSGLNQVTLATNETGSFSNKTIYDSPRQFENISEEYLLSDFIWKNTSFTGNLGYRLWASDAAENTASTAKNSFEVHRIDLEASNISFNATDPVEGQEVNLQLNVTNFGDNATANITVSQQQYNGSRWKSTSNTTVEAELEASKNSLVNFTVTPETGPNRYTAYIDPKNTIKEENESNNNISSILDVSSYHLKYGNSNSALTLGSEQKLKSWTQSDPRGTIFYSDLEASYSIDNLMPLNKSGDLVEADQALGMADHNDSLSSIYDEDQDGVADTTGCIDIAGEIMCEIPLVNSTNTSNFQTGILYDGKDVDRFNGSQDIIFATEIKNEQQGLYGVYNYEIRVPSPLSSQYSPSDFVDLRVELK